MFGFLSLFSFFVNFSIRRWWSLVVGWLNDQIKVVYTWKTSKLRSLFRLKNKVSLSSNVIYEGECSYNESYIGETKRNVIVRWKDHNGSSQKSEPKRLSILFYTQITNLWTWTILSKTSKDTKKRKILEAYFIKTKNPTLNDQKDIKSYIINIRKA